MANTYLSSKDADFVAWLKAGRGSETRGLSKFTFIIAGIIKQFI